MLYSSIFTFLHVLVFATANIVRHDDSTVSWSYNGVCKPDCWASIGYTKCSGSHQSPIDLSSSIPKIGASSNIVFNNYNNIELKEAYLENNGHSVELVIPEQDIGSAKLSGGPLSGSYQLHQLHFHWGEDNSKGSEHTVDGKRFPLEMHLVHVTTDIPYKSTEYPAPHGLAVVSFLFQISDEDNKNMPPITDKIKSISKSHTETDMENFKLSDLISEASEGGYFTYDGSLTTPSCDEVVHWIVFQTPISISSRQIAKYRMAHDSSGARLVNNFRPIQDLNDRTVYNVRSNTSNR